VAVLILIPGENFDIKIGEQTIKAPASHWVVAAGFDDRTQTLYYYDPYEKGEQEMSYDDFLKVWSTEPRDYMEKDFNLLMLTYGFIATKTIAFCNQADGRARMAL